jgi:hypothetical protein
METPSDTSAALEMLIERIETHPEEFFNVDMVAGRGNLSNGMKNVRWMYIVRMLEGPTSVFSDKERACFNEALRRAQRKVIDTEIIRAIVTGEEYGGLPGPPPSAFQNALAGTSTISTNATYGTDGLTDAIKDVAAMQRAQEAMYNKPLCKNPSAAWIEAIKKPFTK